MINARPTNAQYVEYITWVANGFLDTNPTRQYVRFFADTRSEIEKSATAKHAKPSRWKWFLCDELQMRGSIFQIDFMLGPARSTWLPAVYSSDWMRVWTDYLYGVCWLAYVRDVRRGWDVIKVNIYQTGNVCVVMFTRYGLARYRCRNRNYRRL